MKKKEVARWRLLPDGSTTRSARRYIKEWRALGLIIAEELGLPLVLVAFDPGLKFRDETNGQYLTIDPWLVVALVRRFTRGKT